MMMLLVVVAGDNVNSHDNNGYEMMPVVMMTMMMMTTMMIMTNHDEMVHYGIEVRCIVGFLRWVYCNNGSLCGVIYARTSIPVLLTHWGRVTYICVGKLTIIGSDNGLSPWRRQAIIWTNAGILLIGPLGTKFSENLIGIKTFSFKKMPLKMSSAKWRQFCLGLNVLNRRWR